MFVKPKKNKATRHLFVGNCGPAVGVEEHSIATFFNRYKSVAVVIPESPAGASHVFLSFASVEDAQIAVLELSEKAFEELGNRTLKVKYADLKESTVRSHHIMPK